MSKLVVEKLVEVPVQTKPAGGGCHPGWRGWLFTTLVSSPDNAHVEGGSTSGEEFEVEKPRSTLPHYYPLSPSLSSSEAKEQARLKVYPARLKFESQDRIQARQAKFQLPSLNSLSLGVPLTLVCCTKDWFDTIKMLLECGEWSQGKKIKAYLFLRWCCFDACSLPSQLWLECCVSSSCAFYIFCIYTLTSPGCCNLYLKCCSRPLL